MNLTNHLYWESLKEVIFLLFANITQLLWTVGENEKKTFDFKTLLSIILQDIKRFLLIKCCKGMKTLATTKNDSWSKTGTDLFWQAFPFL